MEQNNISQLYSKLSRGGIIILLFSRIKRNYTQLVHRLTSDQHLHYILTIIETTKFQPDFTL